MFAVSELFLYLPRQPQGVFDVILKTAMMCSKKIIIHNLFFLLILLLPACKYTAQICEYNPIYQTSVESATVNDNIVEVITRNSDILYEDDNISVLLVAEDSTQVFTGSDLGIILTNKRGNLMFIPYYEMTLDAHIPDIYLGYKQVSIHDDSPRIPKNESFSFIVKDVFPKSESAGREILGDRRLFEFPDQYTFALSKFNDFVSEIARNSPQTIISPYFSFVVRFSDGEMVHYKFVFKKEGIRYDYRLYEKEYYNESLLYQD